jgi:hypothetical protein
MYKHKPIPVTNVKIGEVVYNCNAQGIVELPERYEQFNPIEEVKIKTVKTVKKTVIKDDSKV